MIERPLEGRVALVTGAKGRLGPTWRDALADAGAVVFGVDLEPGDDQRVHRADVLDRSALEHVRDLVGAVDVLVNNAGIDQPPSASGERRRIQDVSLDDFRRTVDVNLAGTFNAIQVFGAGMATAGGGSIINIGSLYATVAPDPAFYDHLPGEPPFLKPPAYGASKAGVLQLTRYFARLWGPEGVRVNMLSPGGVLGDQDPEFLKKYCARVPLGRMAEPADLRGPLVFLASDDARYLTGHELRIDGGFTA